MNNKKLVLGIAAGAAVLAGAAVIITRNRNNRKFQKNVEAAKENFKHKLDELQRKAKKEYDGITDDAGEVVNAAKERAEKWASKASRA